MTAWHLAADASAAEREWFASLDRVFALEGERVAADGESEVIRLQRDGYCYYVKRYSAAKGLRRWLGRPRIQSEWLNLERFAAWGVPSVPVLARGLERRGLSFARGAMITREVPGTRDMADLARKADPRLQDAAWVAAISTQLAQATRTLHAHHFAHNDLKWRNLLVDEQTRLYLIDCPTGGFWFGPLLRRRIVKDLACLDKVAKYQLSRTQRMRFFLDYRGRTRLSEGDKRRIRQILDYFEGRE